MPSCQSTNFAGVRCSRKLDDLPYFIYHDSQGRLDKVVYLCLDDSNRILGQLMETELGYTRLIDSLRKKTEYIRGLVRQEVSSKNESRQKELKVLYEKIKRFNEIRNIERNRKCRFCGHPLNEPEEPKDQIGRKYSHATFHSDIGKRRADILFHSECGLTWFANTIYMEKKDLKYIAPLRTKQHTMFSFN